MALDIRMRFFVRILAVPAMLLLVGPAAMSATLRVDNMDVGCSDVIGDPYCTINAAIGDAGTNDLVTVSDGTYAENVVVDVEGLRLRAQGRVLVDGSGAAEPAVDITADGVRFESFEVRGGTHGVRAFDVVDVRVLFCHVHDNTEIGIFVTGHGNTIASNNVAHNGTQGIQLGLLACGASTDNEVKDNFLSHDIAPGLRLELVEDSQVIANEIYISTNGAGCHLQESSRNLVRDNRVIGGRTAGYRIVGSDENTFLNNEATGNRFIGWEIREDSDGNVFEGNTATGNNGDGFELANECNDNELTNNVSYGNDGHGFDLRNDSTGNILTGNEAVLNGRFGFDDESGATFADLTNVYVGNVCDLNSDGGSDPTGACTPQP